MKKSFCPGAGGFREPAPEMLCCPYCGTENEIWTDEAIISCTQCKRDLTRSLGPSCLDWCKEAAACVGREKLRIYREAKRRDEPGH